LLVLAEGGFSNSSLFMELHDVSDCKPEGHVAVNLNVIEDSFELLYQIVFYVFLFYSSSYLKVISLIYGFLKQQICCELAHLSLFTFQTHLYSLCREDLCLADVYPYVNSCV
jgi:hypothetical protein